MKKFKRIYIEITNACNLSCSFCKKTKRKIKVMSISEFEKILKRINDYTDYIYLHVKGEPLIHPNLKEILDLAEKYNKKVTITTNGTLLKEKKDILTHSKSIRQINVSLHSENQKENYLDDVFQAVEEISINTRVVYRFWTLVDYMLDSKSAKIVSKMMEYYHLSFETVEKLYTEENISIDHNIYVNKDNEFLWPDLENDYYKEEGYCHALKDQIAILVDGTVVPCCLDGDGIIRLGNILTTKLETILSKHRVAEILKGFRNRKVHEELCKHCNFKEKFDRK